MAERDIVYCTQCGSPGRRDTRYCGVCGMPRALTPKRRAGHVAFLLNELQTPPLDEVLFDNQRERLEGLYGAELDGYLESLAPQRPAPQPGPQQAPPAPAAPAPPVVQQAASQPTPVPVAAATTQAPATRAVYERAAPPPLPPKEPYDWTWLAEQQANLFLFAGAFLTVVAALIYVWYSGQTVSGALKMFLFAAYTLAFLGAGWFCVRVPKVEIAGRVFFGIGALLVPLNFAAARGILADERDLSPESMWLAGSVVTAAFYAAVAWIGLGRMYAIGAGFAMMSAALAIPFATDTPIEWAPLLMIAIAFGMVLSGAAGIEKLRERLGAVWEWQGYALAAMALGLLAIVALFAPVDDGDALFDPINVSTYRFLPITLAAFAAASVVPMLLTKRDRFALAALGGLAGAGVGIAYALQFPAEGWVVTAAATAAYFGLMLIASDEEQIAERLPVRIGEYVFAGGVALTALAGVIALVTLNAAYEDQASYEIEWRWFLAASCGLALAFYALAGASKRGRTGTGAIAVSIGGVAAFAGTWVAVIYGAGWPAEAYAMGIAGMAAALAAALVAAQDERIARHLPERLTDAAAVTALGATVAATIIALVTVVAAEQDVDPYTLSTRWFLATTFGLTFAAYAISGAVRRFRSGDAAFVVSTGGVAAFAATWIAMIYGADWPAEGYAIGIAAMAVALAAALVAAQDERIAGLLPERLTDVAATAAVAATAGAAFIALSIVAASERDVDPYLLSTRWFLAITFGLSLAAYAVSAAVRRFRSGDASFVLSIGAAAFFAATWIASLYAFELRAEGYAIGIAAMAVALGVLGAFAQMRRMEELLPENLLGTGYITGALATIAAAVTIGYALSAAELDESYDLSTRWSLAVVFALSLSFYVIAGATKRMRTGDGALAVSLGGVAAFAGTWIAVIYGFGWTAEAYAIGIAMVAPALALLCIGARREIVARFVPQYTLDTAYAGGVIATIGSTAIAAITIIAAEQDVNSYVLNTRWFLLPAVAISAAFYALDAAWLRRGLGVIGSFFFVAATAAAVVYGLDVSAEYYAFALIAPAIAAIAAVRWAPARIDETLGASWREDTILLGRIATASGLMVAFFAMTTGADASVAWQPQSHIYLPTALFAAAVFCGIDASRGKRIETSAAFVAALGAAAVAVPYAFYAEAAYYGVALIAAGYIFAASGRVITPSWLDARVRDGFAVLGVGGATLPFLAAYADLPGVGAGVHFGAAFFFALVGLTDRSTRTLEYLVNVKAASKVRLAMGWLYAAGLCGALGYIFALQGLATEEQAEGGSLAIPMLTVTVALLAAGVATKFWRPEFRLHLYGMSLIAALISIATSHDAQTLALVLTVFTAAYIIVAVIEHAPMLAAPSLLFGFVAVTAWRVELDASYAVLPLAYSLVAVAAYCGALVVRYALRAAGDRPPSGDVPAPGDQPVAPTARNAWTMALRGAGAAYAIVAPVAGFGVLYANSEGRFYSGEPFEQSALYQFSTLAVAAVGALALIESLLAKRRWIIVPASAVLAIALMLQIGSLHPNNMQAYTTVIGAYLVLLGAVGISRMKLIPQMGDYVMYIEALGASTIMLPSFAQSINGGWRYQWVLLIESILFLTGGIAMRRRGILSAGALFMVAVAGRILFDAINAMPNWIVVALCGIALLGIGMGILLGREQWDRWQRVIAKAWEDVDDEAVAPSVGQ